MIKKLSSLNKKIALIKTKHLIVENELKKLETFDSSYFWGKSHFEEDGTQNYLVFQTIYRKDCPPTTPNKVLNPLVDYVGTKIRVKFNGECLKQEKITFNHEK